MDLLTRGDDALVLSWSIDRRARLIVEKRPTRVVILPPQSAEAKQAGTRYQGRKQAEIERARQQRAGLAL
ncbi:hypothetical protein [Xanthomonas albilineans]|uniref:hypothetical protein n=1 Tax=Xanthomonas albilineans TaxID=29447 RepID=UPI0005F3125D|nr:hypothetical protein [Xanthomonas albilineans]